MKRYFMLFTVLIISFCSATKSTKQAAKTKESKAQAKGNGIFLIGSFNNFTKDNKYTISTDKKLTLSLNKNHFFNIASTEGIYGFYPYKHKLTYKKQADYIIFKGRGDITFEIKGNIDSIIAYKKGDTSKKDMLYCMSEALFQGSGKDISCNVLAIEKTKSDILKIIVFQSIVKGSGAFFIYKKGKVELDYRSGAKPNLDKVNVKQYKDNAFYLQGEGSALVSNVMEPNKELTKIESKGSGKSWNFMEAMNNAYKKAIKAAIRKQRLKYAIGIVKDIDKGVNVSFNKDKAEFLYKTQVRLYILK